MTGVQFAKRLGIRPQSVDALETSEANGSESIYWREAPDSTFASLRMLIAPDASQRYS
jgi:hypothetical protein